MSAVSSPVSSSSSSSSSSASAVRAAPKMSTIRQFGTRQINFAPYLAWRAKNLVKDPKTDMPSPYDVLTNDFRNVIKVKHIKERKIGPSAKGFGTGMRHIVMVYLYDAKIGQVFFQGAICNPDRGSKFLKNKHIDTALMRLFRRSKSFPVDIDHESGIRYTYVSRFKFPVFGRKTHFFQQDVERQVRAALKATNIAGHSDKVDDATETASSAFSEAD